MPIASRGVGHSSASRTRASGPGTPAPALVRVWGDITSFDRRGRFTERRVHQPSVTMVWDPRIELASPAPSRRRTLPMSQMVPRARVERASSVFNGALSPGQLSRMRHPVSVTIRPSRSENPATSQMFNGAGEPASRFDFDLRRYEGRVFPERAGDFFAARAGFEPAVGRLTAACVSASPPGNASRRARRSAHECALPARPFELSKSAGRARAAGLRPEWFSSRVELDPSA